MDEEKKRKEAESKTKWDQNNTVQVGLRLMRKGDADLIKAIEGKESAAGEIKRLARIGLKHDKPEQ